MVGRTRLCCHFLYPIKILLGFVRYTTRRCPLSWWGGGMGLSFKFWPSRSSALCSWLRKALLAVLYLFFMHTMASLMVFSSRPAISVNFSPSRYYRSQVRLRCCKLVIWRAVGRYKVAFHLFEDGCVLLGICWKMPGSSKSFAELANSASKLG